MMVSYTLRGAVTLFEGLKVTWAQHGAPCTGSGGYSDITGGMQVSVRDQDNRLLGLAPTSSGRVTPAASGCRFAFTVEELPEVPFYQLEMGGREAPSYSFAQLEQMDWCVELELGERAPGYVDWEPPADCAPVGPPP